MNIFSFEQVPIITQASPYKMNRPLKGSVLLVGEGDFSLSVSIATQLPGATMVTSSLLDQQQIGLHRNALQNIDTLRLQGKSWIQIEFLFDDSHLAF